MMFGDIGHGTILLIGALYLTFYVKTSTAKTGDLDAAYKMRYLLTVMAFFAIYCGLMYNDFLGLQINFFGSCYDSDSGKQEKGCVYTFGMDPIWGVAKNKLSMYNSLKMKLAIIIGVS